MPAKITWSDLELSRRLGEGQAGVVWLATLKYPFRGLQPGAAVAVKRYKRWVLDQEGQYERIFRELQIGSKVEHPHLVKSYCVIADPDQLPALVMSYCPGYTLEYFIKQIGTQTISVVNKAFEVTGHIASAVAALHEAGAIHRDIKPANIILTNDGAKLMDLGVVAPDRRAESTVTEKFVGSIRYAAPEYLFGERYDRTVDIYSLGAVFYELFTGRLFYESSRNWARLVAARWEAQTSGEPHIPYAEAERQLGIEIAEAAKHVLTTTIAPREQRILDLNSFADAVNSRFWEGPFYAEGGEVAVGEPSVPVIGEWESGGPKYTVKAASSELSHKLTDGERKWLKDHIRHSYWSGTFDAADGEWFTQLAQRGLIRPMSSRATDGHAANSYTRWFNWQIHPAVLACYRYGYFR